MTAFEVKERLRTYQRACRECRKIKSELARVRDGMTDIRSPRMDAMPRGSSLRRSMWVIERGDWLERRLAAAETDRDAALDDVRALIALTHDSDGRDILTLRYVDNVRFEDIPARVLLSERSMWRAYNRAVRDIAENWQ